MAALAQEEHLFSMGVIADVQYADLDDGFTEGRVQRTRQAPNKLQAALAHLSAMQPVPLAVLHLGDIINGNHTPELSNLDFDLVATIFEEMSGRVPAVHVVGNHCLSVPRAVLQQRLRIPSPGYHTLSWGSGWRLVVLDTTEMSGHSGYPPDSWQYQEAQEFMAAHPLSEHNPQMSSWNGGVTRRQLAWLRDELAAAAAAGERVIVASHHPLGQGAARATHMAWNWQAVQEVLLAAPAFRLALAGHDHMGGYACIDGRHFVTVEGLLEAPLDGNAFAALHVYSSRAIMAGFGTVSSRELAV